ncbi:MAG: tRNA 2-thiouridine(34) synthase MnmA [Prosthecochloris sp.]|nr:tRNA 2-thiouridine(34) synthase MnmA [Prosthecochloris sp.]
MKRQLHVITGISGGVDSAVAACLLVEQGHRVTGLHIRILDTTGDDLTPTPCSIDISRDPAFHVPVYTLNLSRSFREKVITDFQDSYLSGLTPNPCTLCNKVIKWTGLLEGCRLLGGDRIATGHYARIDHSGPSPRLLKGRDRGKDQSYFLWMLDRDELDRTLFPLGEYTKPEVRELARSFGVRAAEKKESQEICFVPGNNYREFLKSSLPGLEEQVEGGDIVDDSGRVLGHHAGYPFYTIGQRKGLGISAPSPLYVNRIDAKHNRIHVGSRTSLACRTLSASHLNWIGIDPPSAPIRATARIRYRDTDTPCTIRPTGTSKAEISFDTPKQSVTPGQAVVFYREDDVLGGGIIEHADN